MKFIRLLFSLGLFLIYSINGISGDSSIQFFQSDSAFKAIYLLRYLKEGPELLDPLNTVTVWEYYLLENLSCGLIRDSKSSPSGYEGCIAERFYQSDPHTWIFKIRDLSWSDGTKVSKTDIESWIDRLRKSESRHIQFVKTADRASFDEASRELTLHFPEASSGIVLHELSLADAALFPMDFKNKGWARTVGPYTVKSWSKSDNRLVLSANKLSPFYDKFMPSEVELRELLDQSLRPQLFKSIPVDLILLSGFADDARIKDMLPHAPQVYVCHPTMILFFGINRHNPLAKDIEARHEFSQLVQKVQSEYDPKTEYESTFKIEDQLIPEGFDGRILEKATFKVQPVRVLKGKRIRISLPPALETRMNIIDLMKKEFSKAGVTLDIYFKESDSGQAPKEDFATMSGFIGNQLDPSGSWSFLLYSQEGVLHPWIEDLEPKLKKPSLQGNDEDKRAFFVRLHKEVLAKNFAVPFLLAGQRYLLSEKVDPSKWNRFDSRIRFYELRIK